MNVFKTSLSEVSIGFPLTMQNLTRKDNKFMKEQNKKTKN